MVSDKKDEMLKGKGTWSYKNKLNFHQHTLLVNSV